MDTLKTNTEYIFTYEGLSAVKVVDINALQESLQNYMSKNGQIISIEPTLFSTNIDIHYIPLFNQDLGDIVSLITNGINNIYSAYGGFQYKSVNEKSIINNITSTISTPMGIAVIVGIILLFKIVK